MVQFSDSPLPSFLLAKLTSMGYTTPTEIQQKAIPLALNGSDILASSQTGSGKTAAFVIPIITKILNNLESAALILVPTRELAIQIKDVVHEMRCNERIHTALLFGGTAIDAQTFALRKNPKIVIATPGRLQDHLKRRNINLENFDTLVLDEFDIMLDMGFKDDIANIVRHLPKTRQTLMFSATKRASVINNAKVYLTNFAEISIEQKKETHENIEQKFIEIREDEKYDRLLQEITEREGSVIVFVNMKRIADDLCAWLRKDGIEAQAIHGDLRQRQRENAVKRFREEKYRILIATDVAARGIDIPHIKHVINYDTPRTFEDYTHRIGRTGRGGADGHAICFVTRGEKTFHDNIIRKINSDDSQPVYGNKSFVDRGRGFGGRSNTRRSFPPRENSSFGGRSSGRERRFEGNRDGNRESANRDARSSGTRRFASDGEKRFGERTTGNRNSTGRFDRRRDY